MRPERFRYVGYIFSIVLLINLILSQKGMDFTKDLFSTNSTQTNHVYDWLIPLAGVVSLLVTSEAVGYILNSMSSIWWNIIGGYSSEWKKCSYNIKENILKSYLKINNLNQ